MRRLSLLLFAGAATVLGACGGDQECNQSTSCGSQYVCESNVNITATVPPIQQQTWTVKGCLDSDCDSVDLDRITDSAGYGLLMAQLQSEGGTWKLVSTLGGGPQIDGVTWSLTVTNSHGNVIVQGSDTVHIAPGTASCQDVTVTLP